jgi:hypothetical protein
VKRLILVAAALMMLFTHSLAQAQEREPLAMRIELEWTLAGTVLGAAVGVALWLTDPGNPHNILARSVIEGSALGAAAGAGFGIYILQRSAQLPGAAAQVYDPLNPINRPGRDPIAVERQREDLLSFLRPPFGAAHGRGVEIPLAHFNWKF